MVVGWALTPVFFEETRGKRPPPIYHQVAGKEVGVYPVQYGTAKICAYNVTKCD